jgi:putative ABC transport system permease protein
MLLHYTAIALRSLRRNVTYTFLNIAGMSVGLTAGILILLWTLDEFSFDRFHRNLPNLHVMLQDQKSEGEIMTYTAMPGPLAADLKASFPEITNATRANFISPRLLRTADGEMFREMAHYVEPAFFEMFNFPALVGDPKAAVADPGSVVLTERTAKKIFGSQNPIGQPLNVSGRYDYKVAAIIRDVPENSSIRFDVALPFAVFEKAQANWIYNYQTNSLPMWIETQPGTDMAALNSKLYNFLQAKEPDAASHFHAYPLAKWRLENQFKNGQPSGGRMGMVAMMGLIGLALILVACINFMNLATARSSLRAREVGVRKAIGAARGRLVAQFLSEAMLMVAISFVLALLLALVIMPSFNRYTEKHLALWSAGPLFWGILTGCVVLVGFVAGSYPAFFLSKFNPVRVLKNDFSDQKRGSAEGFRKFLVVSQFTFSSLMVIATILLWQQIEHLRNRPLGYEKDHLLYFSSGFGEGLLQTVKSQVTALPEVKDFTWASDDLSNFGSNTSGIQWPGKTDDQEILIRTTNAGANYVRTAGLKLREGRDFEGLSDQFSCLLNETAVKKMGLKNPVGQQIIYDTTRTIVGVIEDFVQDDPGGLPEPMAIFFDENNTNYYFIRLHDQANTEATLGKIGAIYKKIYPNNMFMPKFMSQEVENRFQKAKLFGMLANVFGGLAIFISCLGLFGLAAFTAERRTKEMGIRKVLGASIAGLMALMAKDFLKLVLIAIVIATPIAIYLGNKVLTLVDYRIELSPWVFIGTGVGAIIVAALTVSLQSLKAALTNPVKSLKSE